MVGNQTEAVHSGEVNNNNNNNNNSGEVQQSLSRGERCRAVIRANLDAYFGATDDAVRLTSDLLVANVAVVRVRHSNSATTLRVSRKGISEVGLKFSRKCLCIAGDADRAQLLQERVSHAP